MASTNSVNENAVGINAAFMNDEGIITQHRQESTKIQLHEEDINLKPLDKETKSNGLLYGIEDNPPWHLCLLLGFQHFLTMVTSTLTIPFAVASATCVTATSPIRMILISTIIFISGIITVIQTTIGVRLPIIQGGTFSLLVPTIAYLETAFPSCESLNLSSMTKEDQEAEFFIRIREVQGCIAVASLFQLIIGFTGLIGVCLRFISPLTVAPTLSLIGLALYEEAIDKASSNWWISSLTVILIALFSQYLPEISVPIPAWSKQKGFHSKDVPIFKLFPVLLGVVISWMVCVILTTTDAIPKDSTTRTDTQLSIIHDSPWVYIPYPFQFGVPTVSLAGVFGIMAGAVVSTIESIGDYYACARMSGAPPPPTHAINRGVGVEGFGCILAALWGTGNGSTSYATNIAAMRITMVGSRRVIQVAGILMIVAGIFGKLCGVFATVPEPVIGGIYLALFALIVGVGLSNLQMVELNSSRNIFILGMSFFLGLAVPAWAKKQDSVITTNYPTFDEMIKVLLRTSMFVGGATSLFLDNTISGTREERGIDLWVGKQDSSDKDKDNGSLVEKTYGFPFGMAAIKRFKACRHIPISPTFEGYLSKNQKIRLSRVYQNIKRNLPNFPRKKSDTAEK